MKIDKTSIAGGDGRRVTIGQIRKDVVKSAAQMEVDDHEASNQL
jgi:hypothetical protein